MDKAICEDDEEEEEEEDREVKDDERNGGESSLEGLSCTSNKQDYTLFFNNVPNDEKQIPKRKAANKMDDNSCHSAEKVHKREIHEESMRCSNPRLTTSGYNFECMTPGFSHAVSSKQAFQNTFMGESIGGGPSSDKNNSVQQAAQSGKKFFEVCGQSQNLGSKSNPCTHEIDTLETSSLQQTTSRMEFSEHGALENTTINQSSELLQDESPQGSESPDEKTPGNGTHLLKQVSAINVGTVSSYDGLPRVQTAWDGTVERKSANSAMQHKSRSRYQLKDIGSYDPLETLQEQSQLRLERDLNTKLFVKTEKIKECEKTLMDWGMLLLTGGPGEGKTTAGLYLLTFMYDSDSRLPLVLTDPNQWDHLSGSTHKNHKYVIFIDDAFGRTNLVDDLKTRWEQKFPMMLPLIEAGTACVIFAFRTNIFLQEEPNRIYEPFKRCQPVNLSSDDITEIERVAMLDKYTRKWKTKISDKEKSKIARCRDVVSFPLSCHLFSLNKRENYDDSFFNCTLEHLSDNISKFRRNDPNAFLVLLLVMFYENLLPKRVFNVFEQGSGDQETIDKLCQVCVVKPLLGSLLNSAGSLCKTFLIFDDKTQCFSFMHNSIQDAVFIEFCKKHLSKGLDMCSVRTLFEYVRTDRNSCRNISVVVPQTYFDKLASRLIKELLSSNNALIVSHPAFKDVCFVKHFYSFLSADMRKEIALYNREIQSCYVHQYLTDTNVTFLLNKSLNQHKDKAMQRTFDPEYINVLSIDSIPACFVLNGADRLAIHFLKHMKQDEELFSRHANITLACSFYVNIRMLVDELIEIGAEITFDCFKAVCVAPRIDENLVKMAAGILSRDLDSLGKLLTLSLEHGHVECVKQLVLFMIKGDNRLQLEEFCRVLLIVCHNTKPSWIWVSQEQATLVKMIELLHSKGVSCSTDSCVLLAAGCHDLDILKLIVECGGNVHCRDDTGQSPLHLAALYGSKDTVLYLIQQKAEKHARDNDGYTPLHRAAQSFTESYEKLVLLADEQLRLNSVESVLDIVIRKGDIESVKYICNNFSDRKSQFGQSLDVAVNELAQALSTRGRGTENMLQAAWTQKRCHIVQHLLTAKFSLNSADVKMISSLNLLVERNNEDLCGAIIESCDLNSMFQLIVVAKQCGHSSLLNIMLGKLKELINTWTCTEIVRLNFYLLTVANIDPLSSEKGDDIDSNDGQGKHFQNISTERIGTSFGNVSGVKISDSKFGNEWSCFPVRGAEHDRLLKTLFHHACERGDTCMVNRLLQSKSDVNIKENQDKTPLHYACKRGDNDIVEALVQRGAEVNAVDKALNTPLHYACQFGNTAVVICLVRKGANVNVNNLERKTPLHYACEQCDIAMVKCLVQTGAGVNVKDKDLNSPIHYACARGDTAIVKCLVYQRDANVNFKDDQRKTLLHYACKQGDIALVECLVLKGADVNVIDIGSNTPLHITCKHGDPVMVKCLVQQRGVNLNVRDDEKKTPLHYACERGDTALVVCLVQSGAVVNVVDKGLHTPLHYACKGSDPSMVECLVQIGANVNVRDNEGKTPLHYACEGGFISLVSVLIISGAQVNALDKVWNTPLHYACKCGDPVMVKCLVQQRGVNLNVRDDERKTPLHYACERGDTAMVKCLVEGAAKMNIKDNEAKTPLHYANEGGYTEIVTYLFPRGAYVEIEDDEMKSLLLCASKRGNTATVKSLVQRGEDVNIRDDENKAPLHYACMLSDTSMLECLVRGGANLNVRDVKKKTPLHYACKHGQNSLVEYLVQGGAKVNVKDWQKKTPLHYVCERGDPTLVSCLVQRGAKVNVRDNEGKTPLHYACSYGDTAIVECMVQNGADVNVRDNERKTPLHCAFERGDTIMIISLVKKGAEVNVRDDENKTLLLCACERRDSAMVDCLVKGGAEVNVRDLEKKTPLHYACRQGDTAIVKCLVQAGADVNCEDCYGETPVHYAYGQDVAIVELMVLGLAEVDVKDKQTKTPLHYVCEHGDVAMAERLIQRSVEMNVRDRHWKTPLHYACEHGYKTIVECLFQKGAIINVENMCGKSPLHYSCERGDATIVEYLVQNGADVNVRDLFGKSPLHYARTHGYEAVVAYLSQDHKHQTS